jgi:DNA-binding protein HU-beta
MTAELESGTAMNQAELIEKIAQAAELNQAAAGQAVKAAVNAILDALVAGEAVRVSGLGTFEVAARPAREGRNPQAGEAIKIAARKAVRSHAGKGTQGRQRCSQPAASTAGSPGEDRTTKEIRGAEVNVLSMCGSAAIVASALAIPRGASSAYPAIRYALAIRRNPVS